MISSYFFSTVMDPIQFHGTLATPTGPIVIRHCGKRNKPPTLLEFPGRGPMGSRHCRTKKGAGLHRPPTVLEAFGQNVAVRETYAVRGAPGYARSAPTLCGTTKYPPLE